MSAAPRTDSDLEVFQWRVHPARERLTAALFALAVIALMSLLSGALMQSLWWGALAFFVPIAALRRFFLPSSFCVDSAGVTASTFWGERRFRWDEIRRFLCDARGGFLSTRGRSSQLDLLRGMHLLFGEDRDVVVRRIRARLKEEGRT